MASYLGNEHWLQVGKKTIGKRLPALGLSAAIPALPRKSPNDTRGKKVRR